MPMMVGGPSALVDVASGLSTIWPPKCCPDQYALEALERFSPGVPPGSQDELLLLVAYDDVTADLVEFLALLGQLLFDFS